MMVKASAGINILAIFIPLAVRMSTVSRSKLATDQCYSSYFITLMSTSSLSSPVGAVLVSWRRYVLILSEAAFLATVSVANIMAFAFGDISIRVGAAVGTFIRCMAGNMLEIISGVSCIPLALWVALLTLLHTKIFSIIHCQFSLLQASR
jgi:Ca2+/H+ antiporter